MAIYHLSVKAISRSAGRSATAAAAYRAGCKIADERTGEIHDYSRKVDIKSEGRCYGDPISSSPKGECIKGLRPTPLSGTSCPSALRAARCCGLPDVGAAPDPVRLRLPRAVARVPLPRI